MCDDKRANRIVADLNNLLKLSGMPVGEVVNDPIVCGAMWCKYGRCFHVWLPKIAGPVIAQVVKKLTRAGLEVESYACDHLNAKYMQIDGEI